GAHVVAAVLMVACCSLSAEAQIATFAGDCTTPKTTFNLSDTVCAIATGLTGFRLQFVNVDGFAINSTSITTDPQTIVFTLPGSDQSTINGLSSNNLGHWRVNAITSDSTVNTNIFFNTKDPAHPSVDLSIVKTYVGNAIPNAGDSIQFAVRIV